MTDTRRRPHLARSWSRSRSPRSSSNAREPICQDTSKTTLARERGPGTYLYTRWQNVRKLFLYCTALMSTIMIGFLLLTGGILATQACDFAAVRATSCMLSGYTQVDFCTARRVNTDLQPSSEFPARDVCQHGEAIGQVVSDMIDSYHVVNQHSQMVERLQELAFLLDTRARPTEIRGEYWPHRAALVLESIGRSFRDIKRDLRSVNDLAVVEYDGVLETIHEMVREAARRRTAERVSRGNRLYQTLLGRWFSQSSPGSSLLAALRKSTTALYPELAALYRSSCDLHRDLENRSEGLEALLKELPKGLESEIEQYSSDLSRLAASIDELDKQSLRLEIRFMNFRELMERCRCLGFSRGGNGENGQECVMLLINSKPVGETWDSVKQNRPHRMEDVLGFPFGMPDSLVREPDSKDILRHPLSEQYGFSGSGHVLWKVSAPDS